MLEQTRSDLSNAVRSSIDIALWDLAARKANRPLYELLGAKRDSMEPYASLPFACTVLFQANACGDRRNSANRAPATKNKKSRSLWDRLFHLRYREHVLNLRGSRSSQGAPVRSIGVKAPRQTDPRSGEGHPAPAKNACGSRFFWNIAVRPQFSVCLNRWTKKTPHEAGFPNAACSISFAEIETTTQRV
jgi:hypothetical protein